MQSRLEALRIIGNWENRMLSPDERSMIDCKCCRNPIDTPYRINDKLYCSDCAHAMCRAWPVEDEVIECEGCGEEIPDDECYYDCGGDPYCAKCFEEFFKEW